MRQTRINTVIAQFNGRNPASILELLTTAATISYCGAVLWVLLSGA